MNSQAPQSQRLLRVFESGAKTVLKRVLRGHPQVLYKLARAYASLPTSSDRTSRPAAQARVGAKLLFRWQYSARPQIPDASGSGGVFFAKRANLPAGPCLIRCQFQFGTHRWSEQARLQITLQTVDEQQTIAQFETDLSAVREAPDEVFYSCTLETSGAYELQAYVSENMSQIHLRLASGHAARHRSEVNYHYDYGESSYGKWPIRKLRNVIIGTTGVCNASCVHCPTNKEVLAHLDRKPMAMDLFQRIIDQIAEERLEIEGELAFGLYGDALMDPFVVERARYVRKRLPWARILINTNGGPFNERKHAPLVDLVSCFSVHCEALTPEVYASLMAPLQASIVFPKIERLAAIASGKVNMCVPVSRKNIDELPRLQNYWMSKGIGAVIPLAFTNRTSFAFDYYNFSLGPSPGVCRQEVASELIVDWDGKVLTCCQDFAKGNCIGDLTKQSLRETLDSSERREVFNGLAAGEWSRFRSCRDCLFDHPKAVERAVAKCRGGASGSV